MSVQLLYLSTENLYSADNSIVAMASWWHTVADTPSPILTGEADADSEIPID